MIIMKFYLDKDGEVFTEEQFKEEYFNEEQIYDILLNNSIFQDNFIKICRACSGLTPIKNAVNCLIKVTQWNAKLLSEYCKYFEIEQREVNNKFIERILKDN